MSDNEVLPSCLTCKWAKSIPGSHSPAWLAHEPRIECSFHHFIVWEPRLRLCSQLADDDGKIDPIVKHQQVTSAQMYVWLEIRYRIIASLELTHTHHELIPITSLKEFVRMTSIEQGHIYHRLHTAKWRVFEQQFGEEIIEEIRYQKTRRLHNRLKPKE